MFDFVENNKRLLINYSKVLRVLGWVLLFMGGIAFVMVNSEYFQSGGKVTFDGTFGMLKRSYSHFIIVGLISLGFGQFVSYICSRDKKVSLLLRHVDKVLYVYAILVVWQEFMYDWLVFTGKMGGGNSVPSDWLLYNLPITLLYKTAKVLTLIGFGFFLKRLLAKIQEEKQKQAPVL